MTLFKERLKITGQAIVFIVLMVLIGTGIIGTIWGLFELIDLITPYVKPYGKYVGYTILFITMGIYPLYLLYNFIKWLLIEPFRKKEVNNE